MNVNDNGLSSRPLLSPDVGDLVFNLNNCSRIYRRMRVVKVTAQQIETIDIMRRRKRYWRKNGYQIGDNFNVLCLIEPSSWSRAFEAKHEVGRPLPELEESIQ